jgi:hypothetical protein
VKGTDSTFDRFKCPLFYKFIISLSGFAERDRNTIKQYVEREGATYSPSLIKDKCTHLICKEPKGEKTRCLVKSRDVRDQKNYTLPGPGPKEKLCQDQNRDRKKNYRNRDQIKRATGTWTGTGIKKVGPAHL